MTARGPPVVRPLRVAATACILVRTAQELRPVGRPEEDLVDEDVSATIRALMAQEHALRAREAQTQQGEPERLASIEVQLDQCWDLLRQRRALRETGQDASAAQARPESVVETYLQ